MRSLRFVNLHCSIALRELKMKNDEKEQPNRTQNVAEEAEPGLIVEFWQFLKHNKKWWLLPLILALLVLGALVVISGSGLVPFIYPFG